MAAFPRQGSLWDRSRCCPRRAAVKVKVPQAGRLYFRKFQTTKTCCMYAPRFETATKAWCERIEKARLGAAPRPCISAGKASHWHTEEGGLSSQRGAAMPPAKSPPKKGLLKVPTGKGGGEMSQRGAPSSRRGAPQDSKRSGKTSPDNKASAAKKPGAAAASNTPPAAKGAKGDKGAATAAAAPTAQKPATSTTGMNKKIDFLTDEVMARKPLDDKARDALIKKCGPPTQE